MKICIKFQQHKSIFFINFDFLILNLKSREFCWISQSISSKFTKSKDRGRCGGNPRTSEALASVQRLDCKAKRIFKDRRALKITELRQAQRGWASKCNALAKTARSLAQWAKNKKF